MSLSSKWRRMFIGTNTFQIILFIILFYSLTSIIIIYIHLVCFFSDDKLWKVPEENASTGDHFISWNMHSILNVLSSQIISSDEISIVGWWMDHAKWETDIKCFNQKWTLCSKGFSSTCKSDGIRAIYQYVIFSKVYRVRGFELSLTATADQLESQTIGASFGALALVKLSDGRTQNVQLQFPSNIEPLTTKNIRFSAGESLITSITIMLMCYGYTGSVHFTDPILLPYASSLQEELKITRKCLSNVGRPPQVQQTLLKQETLLTPNTKSAKEASELITLVTQVSMDRLSILERSLYIWNGPVSLVIFVPAKHSEKSEYDWQRLYIQKKLKNLKMSALSHVKVVFGGSYDGEYPINTLRNIAIKQVQTKYLFLMDADFQPSPEFQQKFSVSIKNKNLSSKIAFVVPAFEYIELPKKSDSAPHTKEELLQLLHREEPFILPFRRTESSESHRVTDYWKWYRADKLYPLQTFCDKYEPYIILQKTNSMPLYDERFSGYGMNKVTHITELFASNYTFMVLPDVWILHLPHKISTYAVEFLQNAHQRLKNRMERFEFIAEAMIKYKIGNCKLSQTE
ncbi:xylosyl- and glucuronyltransferase LARGE2s-like [Uloborus diversus]|uniref:xylosyl- and glucuronyltransferase LARGE2s-like n=1 Tax=Uloborus diversus TaxID=327109 RepID=UPI00240A7BD0|nr:xylosyl- and glucuronyltransferase LARGE2s-like [Uloborus diversus]